MIPYPSVKIIKGYPTKKIYTSTIIIVTFFLSVPVTTKYQVAVYDPKFDPTQKVLNRNRNLLFTLLQLRRNYFSIKMNLMKAAEAVIIMI